MITNANQILFRASSMGDIMTGTAKGWDVENSLTCKKKLMEIFADQVHRRRTEQDNKYTLKGKTVENDAITLLTVITKKFYIKNETRLNDEYFTGEWDVNDNPITETIDTKAKYSLVTFLEDTLNKKDKSYEYQGQVYMHLTGAKKHTIANCLVNNTAKAIEKEKLFLSYSEGMTDEHGNESPEYILKCQQIERNHIFDINLFNKRYPNYPFHSAVKFTPSGDMAYWHHDIPKEQRLFLFEPIIYDPLIINAMKARIDDCRQWMNKNLFNVSEFASQPQELAELSA